MQGDHLITKVFRFLDILVKLVWINILWICFSLAGLIVFGVFPATVACCEIFKRWHEKQYDIPIFKVFLLTFKKQFKTANVIGFVLVITGYILYVDMKILAAFDHMMASVLMAVLVSLSIFQMLIILFVFPMIVLFDMKTWSYFKNAFILAISYPIHSLIMLAGFMVMLTLSMQFQVFLPFIAVSLFWLMIIYVIYDVFTRVRKLTQTQEA